MFSDLGALSGELQVHLGTTVPDTLRSTRRDWARHLACGRPVATLPDLMAALFNQCATAHRLCSEMAIEAAIGVDPSCDSDIAASLQVETIREHIRRIALDWPRWLLSTGTPSNTAAHPDTVTALAQCPLIQRRAPVPEYDAVVKTRQWLEQQWLGMPAADWLNAWEADSEGALREWVRRTDTLLSTLMQAALSDADPAVEADGALQIHQASSALIALSEALDQCQGDPSQVFVVRPLYANRPRHTGVWTRRHDPLPARALRPALMLAYRVADLVRLCLDDEKQGQGQHWLDYGAMMIAPGVGLAWAEMARGLLIHRVSMHANGPGEVSDCRVIAPTDWNTHPQGAMARALENTAQQHQAHRLIAAFDPCIPVSVRRDSTTMPMSSGVSHA